MSRATWAAIVTGAVVTGVLLAAVQILRVAGVTAPHDALGVTSFTHASVLAIVDAEIAKRVNAQRLRVAMGTTAPPVLYVYGAPAYVAPTTFSPS